MIEISTQMKVSLVRIHRSLPVNRKTYKLTDSLNCSTV